MVTRVRKEQTNKCISIFGFKKDIKPLIRTLRRVRLADLKKDATLKNTYIYGKITSQCHVDGGAEIQLSVMDESTDLLLPVYLKGTAAKQYPKCESTTGYELYLHKVQVTCGRELEWSQSSLCSVTVTGRDGEKVWLLRKSKVGRPTRLSTVGRPTKLSAARNRLESNYVMYYRQGFH